ncbi:hypothetical protein [Streptomyces endophyticus]|uniref:Tat pathway signal sequence domain protein n=1 Tax=Streptomyces endophyticus TaxID=714166 RepID=A0ABU6F6L1_9ACTN|nr:hypothetical protein [Streptomyces endophyticus]MEB8339469.1 hypothetical protein [Streptomyces endophyticus]
MTGIGPVEPYETADDSHSPAAHPADVVGADAPRPYERWSALPPRGRRLLLAGTVAVAAVAGALLLPHPERPVPAPPDPWPAQVTHLTYEGARGETFRFSVRVDHGTTVTIGHIRAGDPRLTVTATPGPPLDITPDTPRALTVRIAVRDCSALPRALDMAYLDLALTNRRARELHSFIFVDRYPHDLLTLLRARCAQPRTELTQR